MSPLLRHCDGDWGAASHYRVQVSNRTSYARRCGRRRSSTHCRGTANHTLEAKVQESASLGSRVTQLYHKPAEKYSPNLVATVLQAITVQMTQGASVKAIVVGVGPHVDDDTCDVNFGESSDWTRSSMTKTRVLNETWRVRTWTSA